MTGWAINETDEQAIALLPEKVWTAALRQDGEVHEIKGPNGEWISYQVAELTGLRDLTGWPRGMRLIVRRVKPSRDAKKLTAFEKRTGWRYQITATNIPAHQGLSGVPASGQVWFLDALYRDHAEVEDRVKAIKRVGLGLGTHPNLPAVAKHAARVLPRHTERLCRAGADQHRRPGAADQGTRPRAGGQADEDADCRGPDPAPAPPPRPEGGRDPGGGTA